MRSIGTLAVRRRKIDMYGKILITCSLVVRTGLHIGGSGMFSPIGAVDSPVIRDPLTRQPIVPGSSLKGKLRTLLVRKDSYGEGEGEGIIRLPEIDPKKGNVKVERQEIRQLFGCAHPVCRSRLQFSDCFVTNVEEMGVVGLTEVKTENAIRRDNAVANPRQIERVNPGVKFGVKIVYDIMDSKETKGDLTLLAKGMKLLQLDYLGGHGSRGSGRVSFEDFSLKYYGEDREDEQGDDKLKELESLFKKVEHYGPFSV